MKEQEKVWDLIAQSWASVRQRPFSIVEQFLKNKKGKILDLGCGSGRNFIKTNAKIYGIDFSKLMIKYAEQKAESLGIEAEFKVSKTSEIPYPENYFDSAICFSVLHCIQTKTERQKTIKELFRVLKPKAEALISVWSRNSERLKNKPKETFIPWTINKEKQKRFTYIYDKEELESEIRQAGFKIIKSSQDKNINFFVQKQP